MLLSFLRFQRRNATMPAMMARTARPPTTPPAMAPALECEVEFEEPLFDVELELEAVELPEAAARVAEVAVLAESGTL